LKLYRTRTTACARPTYFLAMSCRVSPLGLAFTLPCIT